MDPRFAKEINKRVHKLNPDIANGLAQLHGKHIEAYVHSIIKALEPGFPPGVTYDDNCRRCTPEEEFCNLRKQTGSKRIYDVSRSDMYTMVYTFDVHGTKVTKHISLPFIGEAGTLFMSGTRWLVSPILADKVVSVTMNSVFVRLVRARPTFFREPFPFYANGQSVPSQVVWAALYNKQPSSDVKAKSTMVHYLMCKYGFSETFRRFCGFIPLVGTTDTLKKVDFPEDEYVYCTPMDSKPRGMVSRNYHRSNIAVVVPVSMWNETTANMVAGFMYVVSFFANRIDVADVDKLTTWRRFMGNIIFGSNMNHGQLLNKIDEHIRSLDEYIDDIMVLQFREIGIPVNDIYEFFFYLIQNFNSMMLGKDDKVATMYGKELSILYYLLDPIKSALVRFYFKLKSMKPEDINAANVQKHLDNIVKTGTIFKITKENGEVNPTAFPGDCAPFKLTTILIPQANSNKRLTRGSKDGTSVNDPSQRCHVSIMEIGSHLYLPKTDPSGRSRINPFVRTDAKGNVLRHEDLIELTDLVQNNIRRN